MRLTGIDELHDNTSCQEVNRVVLKSLERTSTTHKEPPVQLMLFFEQSHSTSWIETMRSLDRMNMLCSSSVTTNGLSTKEVLGLKTSACAYNI